jgi:hypothetical protein
MRLKSTTSIGPLLVLLAAVVVVGTAGLPGVLDLVRPIQEKWDNHHLASYLAASRALVELVCDPLLEQSRGVLTKD